MSKKHGSGPFASAWRGSVLEGVKRDLEGLGFCSVGVGYEALTEKLFSTTDKEMVGQAGCAKHDGHQVPLPRRQVCAVLYLCS